MRDRAPAYRDLILHSDVLCLVALREGGRTENALETEKEREMLIRAPAHVQPALEILCQHSSQSTPSPLCELA